MSYLHILHPTHSHSPHIAFIHLNPPFPAKAECEKTVNFACILSETIVSETVVENITKSSS